MAVRYDMRPESDGWTVYDIVTGLPASVNSVSLTRLPLEDADDLADLLNGLHTQQLAVTSH
jgi:hypothetical protein